MYSLKLNFYTLVLSALQVMVYENASQNRAKKQYPKMRTFFARAIKYLGDVYTINLLQFTTSCFYTRFNALKPFMHPCGLLSHTVNVWQILIQIFVAFLTKTNIKIQNMPFCFSFTNQISLHKKATSCKIFLAKLCSVVNLKIK